MQSEIKAQVLEQGSRHTRKYTSTLQTHTHGQQVAPIVTM
jgi:hypothetical protein